MSKELSNIDIVLFALYKLGGLSKKIHTEDIAWESFKLSRERFSWRLPKYREKGIPDKSIIYHALGDAKKRKYGNLVTGRGGGDIGRSELEGWQFTPNGAKWIKENEIRISESLKQKFPDMPKKRAEHFIKKIKQDICFKEFSRDKSLTNVTSYMFTDMLGCTPDAQKEIIKQKFNRLLAKANLVNDSEILRFLKDCEKKFFSILN